jgi:hypothetical protein
VVETFSKPTDVDLNAGDRWLYWLKWHKKDPCKLVQIIRVRVRCRNSLAYLEFVYKDAFNPSVDIRNTGHLKNFEDLKETWAAREAYFGILKPKSGRKPGFGNLANLTRENLVGLYAYLWAFHQDNNLPTPTLTELEAYLDVGRHTFWRWRKKNNLISDEELTILQQEAIDLSKSIPKAKDPRSLIFKQ